MLKNSPTLIALCVSYVVSLALLNNFMQVISKELRYALGAEMDAIISTHSIGLPLGSNHALILCFPRIKRKLLFLTPYDLNIVRLSHDSAIIRQLVSTCRVVVVWGVGLIIYNYDQSLGESWDKWSFMQLGAFIVLVRGRISDIQRKRGVQVYDECRGRC